MKKTIAITLMIILLLNVLALAPVYAAPTASDVIGGQTQLEGVQGQNAVNQLQENGTSQTGIDKSQNISGKNVLVAQKQDAKSGALGTEQDSFIAAMFAWIIRGLTALLQAPLTWIATGGESIVNDSFKIEKLVFNEYKLFDINYFSSDSGTGNIGVLMTELKQSVASWYYGMRTIAIVASLCTLIYIGIRMALSTAATDKVRYKTMFTHWLQAMVMIFVLHYFIMILIYFSDTLVSMLKTIKGNIGIEDNLQNQLMNNNNYSGWQLLGIAIMQFTFVYLQFKFFTIYFKRLIVSGFLIMISPLITITYPINRAENQVAAAFKNWTKEMITIVLVQPMHALLFIIFALSAGEIAKFSIFIALLLLWALSKGEGILRNIFKLNGSSSVKSLEQTKAFTNII